MLHFWWLPFHFQLSWFLQAHRHLGTVQKLTNLTQDKHLSSNYREVFGFLQCLGQLQREQTSGSAFPPHSQLRNIRHKRPKQWSKQLNNLSQTYLGGKKSE